jgi:hypothetical protein
MSRTRKAYAIRFKGRDDDRISIVHAPSAGKARADLYRDLSDVYSWSWHEFVTEIESCRRSPADDITLPERHPLAELVAPELIDMAVHAYGGRSAKAGYRDHYFTSLDDWRMKACVYHGLFERGNTFKRRGSHDKHDAYFILTSLGTNVARGEQPTYPTH